VDDGLPGPRAPFRTSRSVARLEPASRAHDRSGVGRYVDQVADVGELRGDVEGLTAHRWRFRASCH